MFKSYVSKSEKCSFGPESSIDTSNFPQRIENMQRCDCGLKQPSSLGGSIQRFG